MTNKSDKERYQKFQQEYIEKKENDEDVIDVEFSVVPKPKLPKIIPLTMVAIAMLSSANNRLINESKIEEEILNRMGKDKTRD